ncbi:hypothetical protein [Cryptosporangium phraense]|uniref:hypothetical protein n=1 Tax=Cryptosporangium phraense TaxID=2593070 RepID=UPI001F0EAAFD|nr:hypothetical protein [Cryptosporangium phraense]
MSTAPDPSHEHPLIAPIRRAMVGRPTGDAWEVERLDRVVGDLFNTWQSRSATRMVDVARELPTVVTQLRLHDGNQEAAGPVTAGWHLVRAAGKKLHGLDLTHVAADRAARVSLNSGDLGLEMLASWNAGQATSHAGWTEEALFIVSEAIEAGRPYIADGPTSLRAIWGNLHLSAAVLRGRMDDFDRADELLTEADRIAATTGEHNAYRAAFGPSNVGIHALTMWMEAGRYDRARKIADQVDATRNPSIERQFAYALHSAAIYVGLKQDVAALAMLQRAWAATPEETTLNPLARQLVGGLLRRETPAVKEDLRPLALGMRLIA